MNEVNAFRTFIRAYSLFKRERLRANIKLILHKALIRSVMTYACLACEFAADSHLLKSQRSQNKVLHIISKISSYTPFRELHVAFEVPYTVFMII
jgi:hypothetical protein